MRLKQVSYVPIRDDSYATFSSNEHSFVQQSLVNFGLRLDGRSLMQLRPARIQLTRSASDGTTGCTVQWGSNLSVHCQCAGQVVPPTADRPNEGFIQIYVDLSPMASTGFKFGNAVSNVGGGINNNNTRSGGALDDTQKLQANRLLRHLENLLTHCLDSEALVIIPGQWVWQLQVRVSVWDCVGNGNLLDATVLCVLAALRHYRQPSTTMTTNRGGNDSQEDEPSSIMSASPQTISLDQKEGTPLPLHHTPLSVTFVWLLKGHDGNSTDNFSPMLIDPDDEDAALDHLVLLVDPTWQEQVVAAGNELTLSLNVHGEVCGMVSSGAGITQPLVRQCHAQAMALLPQLVRSLETTLQEANVQALQEGLQRMQQQQKLKLEESKQVEVPMDHNDNGQVLQAAEELYRKQALEYNLGHQAVQVRDVDSQQKKNKPPSRLLQSLLQAVSQQKPSEPEQRKGLLPLTDKEMTEKSAEKTSTTRVRAPPDSSGITVLKLTKPENSDTVVVDESTVPQRPTPLLTDGVLDSEEEEETTQLTSEFGTSTAQPKKRRSDNNDEEYNAILAENREQLDAEEEEVFWEEQRNTNLPSSNQEGDAESSWGTDKIKGGRIPKAPVLGPDGKPNPHHKARQMANRRNQQKKAMNKRTGGENA